MSKNDKNNNFDCYDKPKIKSLIWVNPTNNPLSTGNATLQKLQNNKKYVVTKSTVLIPCTKRKLPASVQVHFSTMTTSAPTVPVTRLFWHCSHLVQKSLKILNATDKYTVTRKAHRVSSIKWVGIDSGTSGNYYHSSYEGENYNPLAPTVIVGCANDTAIKSKT